METAIADTGFVVALLNQRDNRHQDVVPIYTQRSQIILPQTVLAEVAYLIGRDVEIIPVAAFLKGISASRFQLTALNDRDINRAAEILETYADSRIDFVDATVMSFTRGGTCFANRGTVSERCDLDTRPKRLPPISSATLYEL